MRFVSTNYHFDMIFGDFNPSQYANQYIYQKSEHLERYEIECQPELWQEIVECFGKIATIINKGHVFITVKVTAIPSVMHSWIMNHINECKINSPKRFRDEIQQTVMEAYKKYWR